MSACPIASCQGSAEWPLPLCQRHWYRVPHPLRTTLWTAARSGAASADYQAAAQEAIAASQAAVTPSKALPCV